MMESVDGNEDIEMVKNANNSDMKYEDWMEFELYEMGYTVLSHDKILKMLGEKTCNNVGYFFD
jgi:hypothetical protein